MEQEINFPLYIGRLYTHKNGGIPYVLTDTCLVQIDDIWHNGVVYQISDGSGKTYARTLDDFATSFTMDPLPEGYHDTKVIDTPVHDTSVHDEIFSFISKHEVSLSIEMRERDVEAKFTTYGNRAGCRAIDEIIQMLDESTKIKVIDMMKNKNAG